MIIKNPEYFTPKQYKRYLITLSELRTTYIQEILTEKNNILPIVMQKEIHEILEPIFINQLTPQERIVLLAQASLTIKHLKTKDTKKTNEVSNIVYDLHRILYLLNQYNINSS